MNKRILRDALRIAWAHFTPEKHPDWGSKFNHYAFIVQRGKIVGWGFNRPGIGVAQTYLGYADYSKIHAECDAFRRCKGIMDHTKPFDVINICIDWLHRVRMSCPCDNCFSFLHNVGCRWVWFSTPTGFSKIYIGGHK